MNVALLAASGMEGLTNLVGILIYGAQAVVALWGTYCIVMVWLRVSQKRFATAQEQQQWLQQLGPAILSGDEAAARGQVAGDVRALPQLAELALENRSLPPTRLHRLLADRFQRDVLADLDHRLSWVNTAIKSEPMLGLLGTVAGMMGAFGQLATAENVRPDQLAENISLALITTFVGLSIAIPLMIGMNSVQVRISKLEDLMDAGMRHLLELFEDSAKPATK